MNIFILDPNPRLAAAYRTYYMNDKRSFARWTLDNQPEWWK